MTDIKYYAHTAGDGWEPLEHHLRLCGRLCAEFLAPIGYEQIGRMIGLTHDLGKRSAEFQAVLRHERVHVNHAWAGAACLHAIGQQNRSLATIMDSAADAVAAHHTCIDRLNTLSAYDILKSDGCTVDPAGNTVAVATSSDLREAIRWLKNIAPELIAKPEPAHIAASGEVITDNISRMLMTRFLLSGLVDADWTATASLGDPTLKDTYAAKALDCHDAIERLRGLRAEKRANAPKTRLNALRDTLFDQCDQAGREPPGLYTLTAPTGLGKTLALAAFALRHCETHHKRRVIIILPFLAIAEQNTAEYKRVFPDLIESHSGAVREETGSVNGQDDTTARFRRLQERWNSTCIVTTTVGFFEPLFADKPARCRNLHQIADSVIVLDEAQSLPPDMLDKTLLCLKELCDRYGCSVLLSTATQPSFRYRAGVGSRWTPREIVSDPQALFNEVRRVRYEWRLDEGTALDDLACEIAQQRQALVIVNTRGIAQRLFKEIRTMRGDEAFLISTDLCKAHREDVLRRVRQLLAEDRACVLVSTQCIEAGVDISFPVLYRHLGPLESIIQAAGRCNRHGDAPDGRVVIFRLPQSEHPYPGASYERAAKCVSMLLSRHDIDCSDLTHIDEYYSLVYPDDGGDAPGLTEAIEHMDYSATADQYHLIRTQGVHVIVPYDGAREAFETLRDLADKEGLTRRLMTLAAPYTVDIPLNLVQQWALPIMVHAACGQTSSANWYILGNKDRYDPRCGIIRQTDDDIMLY